MLGINYPALPATATDFLGAIWKAYVHTRLSPDYLVIYTSPELFKLYKDECENNSRYYAVDPQMRDFIPTKYQYRTARVKQDPDLQGFKVRLLEDEFAWKN